MGILDQEQPTNDYGQQMPQSYMQPAPTPMNVTGGPSSDFFWFRLTSGDILEEIEHQLRGEVKEMNKDGEWIWVQKWKPLMNEYGIRTMLHIIYSAGLNKSIVLGNLQHEQINQRCNSLWFSIAALLAFNCEEYGLNKDMRSAMCLTLVYAIHSGLSRSELGREADQLSSSHQKMEHFMHNDNPPRPNYNPLSFIFNRGQYK